ncbi:hypothetical protein [Streptomyces canus]|uniref:hypothetical protein n=1 Tax=Streptomyces canus TaxID=58343 RepID=UPI001319B974|nr:hypothetical protein [Streptomyces canus]
MGKYTFQPGVDHTAQTATGTAPRGDAQSERQVTQPLLREFLVLLEGIQQELNSRWNGQDNSGRRVQRDGSHFRES